MGFTKWPDLTRTAAALATFDAGAAARWAIDDVDEWLAAQNAAWELVTDAFALDTADRNSRDRAKLIDATTLREWLRKWKTEKILEDNH